jgi:hypothetical protein
VQPITIHLSLAQKNLPQEHSTQNIPVLNSLANKKCSKRCANQNLPSLNSPPHTGLRAVEPTIVNAIAEQHSPKETCVANISSTVEVVNLKSASK